MRVPADASPCQHQDLSVDDGQHGQIQESRKAHDETRIENGYEGLKSSQVLWKGKDLELVSRKHTDIIPYLLKWL